VAFRCAHADSQPLPPVPSRGTHVTSCICMAILAWWFAGLNDRRIRPAFAPRLVRFQKDIVRAASAMLFGNASAETAPEEVATGKIIRLQDWLVPRPELFALFDGYRLNSRGGGRSPIQSRPGRRATAVLYRQRGMLPRLHRLERTAALKGEGLGDNAGVRGPACDGCGHVDRLIP
jgi:hypothetical protein